MEQETGRGIGNGRIIGRTAKVTDDLKIKVYDFKRPDKFSFDQIRTVAIMHETFARLLSTTLSARLRSNVHLHLAQVDQMTYEEFIRSIPNPTTIAIVQMKPLKGSALLEIDPDITFSMIDRLFGGKGEKLNFSRDLTNIEQSVMELIIGEILGKLSESWNAVLELKPVLGQIETNPGFALIVPPTEMIMLVTLEVKCNDNQGMINFCIPFLTIEPVIHKLTAQYWYSSVRKEPQKIKPDVSSFKIESGIFFEGEHILLSELLQLKKNSLLPLTGYKHGEGYLQSGGRRVLKLKHVPGNNRKQMVFIVMKEDRESDDVEELVSPALHQKKGNGVKQLEELIRGPITELTAEFRQNMEELNKRIRDVNARQDELVDQLYFSMPDKDIPMESKGDQLQKRPFDFIDSPDSDLIFLLLAREHPQTIALVLSYLDPNISAYIISKLPEELQVDVIKRIAALDRTAPDILNEVEHALKTKLKAASVVKHATAGGIGAICEILNITSRATETRIIKTLEKQSPELAEDIKAHLFIFEDISLLSDDIIKVVLKNIDKQDLLIALKSADEELRETMYRNMSLAEAKEFKQKYIELGSMRLSDVEAAQKRIVQVIKELDESGTIVVAGKDELV